MGYLTKNTFISWYGEYERKQDFQVGYFSTSGKYSDEQRQFAVQKYLEHNQCEASTLWALGYALPQLMVKKFNYPCGQARLDGSQNCTCTKIGPSRRRFSTKRNFSPQLRLSLVRMKPAPSSHLGAHGGNLAWRKL